MSNNKKFEFKIEKGHLIVGDDEIYLNWVNNIGIRESAMRQGEYAIHIETAGSLFSIIELYYTGESEDVYAAFEELTKAIIEEYPVFRPIFHTELINFRNVQDVSYNPGLLQNSKVKISFKRGEDLVRVASKVEYKNLKSDFEEYRENRKKGLTI